MSSANIHPGERASLIRASVVKSIRDRLAEQQIKGKKSQAKVALEMLIGAIAALIAVDEIAAVNNLSRLAMLVSVRGIEALPS